jgi:hypothetical protein
LRPTLSDGLPLLLGNIISALSFRSAMKNSNAAWFFDMGIYPASGHSGCNSRPNPAFRRKALARRRPLGQNRPYLMNGST